MNAATQASRSAKILALLHCPNATPGERASARLRLREMGVPDCRCQLCAPPRHKSFEPSDYLERREARIKYRADRTDAVAWASGVARDIRTKHGPLEIDDFGMSLDAIMEKYPSPHADRSILSGELEQHRMKVSGGWVEISVALWRVC
jgi:hypothetical protein